MALIAIDMIPMLPGGANGGVKLLALELIKGFQKLSQTDRFVVLTASWNHQELAALDSPNTQRICVVNMPEQQHADINGSQAQTPTLVKRLRRMYHLLPRRIRERMSRDALLRLTGKVRGMYEVFQNRHRKYPDHDGFLSALNVDVLFCPFTAPNMAEPGISVVSLVCDLQHRDYPQFFSAHQINERDIFFNQVKKKADAVICISENTRCSVIRHLGIRADKVHAVPICIQSRLPGFNATRVDQDQDLSDLRIDKNPYMFYPANFWPHKNHQMLITAYGMYLSRHPDSRLDLVLTGALDEARNSLQDKIRRMGLAGRVHFLGYLPENQLSSVWRGCSFLIFPSLYEGFGIPVLEAMEFGKPVLCSNSTSLPEVAGNAALFFDPRKPAEIVECIEKITVGNSLYHDLVTRGYENLARYRWQDMVEKYLNCIEMVIARRVQMPTNLK